MAEQQSRKGNWIIISDQQDLPADVVADTLNYANSVDQQRIIANRPRQIASTIMAQHNDAMVTVVILDNVKYVQVNYNPPKKKVQPIILPVKQLIEGIRLYPPSFVSGAVMNLRDKEYEMPVVVTDENGKKKTVIKKFIGYKEVRMCENITKYMHSDWCAIKLYTPLYPALSYMFQIGSDLLPQHTVKAHIYSGVMRVVVQLILGFGNDLLAYDYIPKKAEALTKETGEWVKPHVFGVLFRLAGSENIAWMYPRILPLIAYQPITVRYFSSYFKTHGVIFGRRIVLDAIPAPEFAFLAADKERMYEPFLVEITMTGIHVMPLPRLFMTFLYEVREFYKQFYPELDQFYVTEDGNLFDVLGGIPSGETFPVGSMLRRAVKSGYIVKADFDISSFYSGNQALSPDIGWSFAETKPYATNVRIIEKDGVPYAECWHLEFIIEQKTNIHFCKYAPQLIRLYGLTNFYDRIKAYLMDDETAESLLEKPNLELFEEYEAPPLWRVRVVKHIVAEGHISIPKGVHFKVPFRMLGSLVSALVGDRRDADNKRIEGPVFSCFAGDDLSVLYMYKRVESRPPQLDIPPCIVSGMYVYDALAGVSDTYAGFYNEMHLFYKDTHSARIDRTIYELQYLGYTDSASLCIPWGTSIHTIRSLYSSVQNIVIRDNKIMYRVAASCVLDCRDLYLMIEEDTKETGMYLNISLYSKWMGDTGYSDHYTIFNVHHHFLLCPTPDVENYYAGRFFYGGMVYMITPTGDNWIFLRDIMEYYYEVVLSVHFNRYISKALYLYYLLSGRSWPIPGARTLTVNEHVYKPYATFLSRTDSDSCLAQYGAPSELIYGGRFYHDEEMQGTLGIYNNARGSVNPTSVIKQADKRVKRVVHITLSGYKLLHNRIVVNLEDSGPGESFDMWFTYIDGYQISLPWRVQISSLGQPYFLLFANCGTGQRVSLDNDDYLSINPGFGTIVGYLT